MSSWVIAVGVVLDVVAAVLYVAAVRESRRIERDRRRAGLVPLNETRVDEATRRLRP